MALRAAPESEIEYLKTDPDLPAVGVVDRTPISPAARITFAVLGLLGGIAWAMIAFVRGENINAVWFVVAAVCTYVIAYRFYARLIECKIVQPARRPGHPRRDPGERQGLHADGPAGAVRAPLRRHRRRRARWSARCSPRRWATCPARSGSSSASSSPGRSRTTWCCGSPRSAAAAASARWPATNSAVVGGVAAHDRRLRHHDHPPRGARPRRRQRARREPVGRLLHRA